MARAVVTKPIYEDFFLDKNSDLLADVGELVMVLETRYPGFMRWRQHKCRTARGREFFCGDGSIRLD